MASFLVFLEDFNKVLAIGDCSSACIILTFVIYIIFSFFHAHVDVWTFWEKDIGLEFISLILHSDLFIVTTILSYLHVFEKLIHRLYVL